MDYRVRSFRPFVWFRSHLYNGQNKLDGAEIIFSKMATFVAVAAF
jgi:hypothetical protein